MNLEIIKKALLFIIKEVGDMIAIRNQECFSIKEKSTSNNLVTEIDELAEKMIRDFVAKSFPDHGFLGEEMGEYQDEAEFIWVVDPIDGTGNYAHRIPFYCVSIGIQYHDRMVLGAIYNPVIKELFFAEKGKGAFLNNEKIEVSKQEKWNNSLLATGFPYELPANENITDIVAEVIHQGLPIRRLGSAAMDLAYVACGRLDGFWEFNLSPWDVAAGYLIVEEAGGRITNFSNEKFDIQGKELIATNGFIHNELLEIIKQHR